MTAIRPNAEPAATTVQNGDIFLIDGATGVRALDASKVPLRDASGNIALNNSVLGYTTTATAAGTTVLTAASTWAQYFTGTTTQTITLPVVSTLTQDHSFYIQNSSTGALTVNSSGGNLVITIAPGASALVTCILITGTSAASWSAKYHAALVASGKSLTVSNTITLTGTDGTSHALPATNSTIARTDAANGGSLTTNSATGGVGYATGAGGAVTQLTGRTTGVTLNTPTGAITLFAAAPVVNTWVSFTVTNSAVAATDVPHVSVKSGTNTYIAHVTSVAAGSFQISFTSIVGTASDSPVFNFAVVKGVAS